MTPSEKIDQMIAGLGDRRGKTFAAIRKTILSADRDIIEEWKWMGSPVWSRDGMIAVANAHKGKVKITFAHGAHLKDPGKLFNAGNGNERKEIDIFEGDELDLPSLKQLVRAAIEYNQTKLKKSTSVKARKSKKA
jgi:hypothetical protein